MKKIKLQPEYSKNGSYIQLCLPIETEVFIPVDHKVRLLDQVFESLDYSKLYWSYSPIGRNPAVSPKGLFKVMVFAYSQGIWSTRKIEEACRLNLAFQYLLHGEKCPDHNTLYRFRKYHLSYCAEDLLTQFIDLLAEQGEILFENLFVDGTKIEADANRYSFVWAKVVRKNAERLQIKARAFLQERQLLAAIPETLQAADLRMALRNLEKEKERLGIVFVSGHGHYKSQLQRDTETLQDFLLRQEKYEHYSTLFRGRNSFSKTDPDATFMHLKEDPMRNGQLKPAYNLQLGVENEYIVGLDLSSERNDLYTLKPFVKRLERNYGRRFKNFISDAGYESEENYRYLENISMTSYIKPSNYEYSKTRKFQRDMEFRLSMQYDQEQDLYRCKGGRVLRFSGLKNQKSKSGYVSQKKIYTCESCADCPHLGSCYKGKYSKQLQVSETFDRYREKSRQNIVSEKGIQLRVNRSIQAEGAFALLKWDQSFRRFLTRGEGNVRTECLLLALGFNLNKLHRRLQDGRFGQGLFSVKSSA